MKVFHGNFVHAPSFGQLQVLEDVYVGIEDGIIVFIQKDIVEYYDRYNITKEDVFDYYSMIILL